MLLIWFFLSIGLILLIFARIPKDNSGLAMSLTPSNFLGPVSQIDVTINILITLGVLCYVLIAFKLNVNV